MSHALGGMEQPRENFSLELRRMGFSEECISSVSRMEPADLNSALDLANDYNLSPKVGGAVDHVHNNTNSSATSIQQQQVTKSDGPSMTAHRPSQESSEESRVERAPPVDINPEMQAHGFQGAPARHHPPNVIPTPLGGILHPPSFGMRMNGMPGQFPMHMPPPMLGFHNAPHGQMQMPRPHALPQNVGGPRMFMAPMHPPTHMMHGMHQPPNQSPQAGQFYLPQGFMPGPHSVPIGPPHSSQVVNDLAPNVQAFFQNVSNLQQQQHMRHTPGMPPMGAPSHHPPTAPPESMPPTLAHPHDPAPQSPSERGHEGLCAGVQQLFNTFSAMSIPASSPPPNTSMTRQQQQQQQHHHQGVRKMHSEPSMSLQTESVQANGRGHMHQSHSHVAEPELPKSTVTAVLFGYVGSRYHGLQKHDNGPHTIEKDLESALIKARAITQGQSKHDGIFRNGDLTDCVWTHASRTDKGVHAVGQCVAFVMTGPPEDMTWEQHNAQMTVKVNKMLADQAREYFRAEVPDIVVYGMRQVVRGFYDERRIMPGCSCTQFHARKDATGRLYEYQCPSAALVQRKHAGAEGLEGIRITPEEIVRVNQVLKMFEGSHDFHNFTADKCSDEEATKTVRVVTRFTCDQVRVNSYGVEYVSLLVEGDSFIYHQIRKMVGLAIFVLRYKNDSERVPFIKSVIDDQEKRYVPVAPSLGLMLERVFYQKENKTHGRPTCLLDFKAMEDQMKGFKEQRIYPEIDAKEQEEQQRSEATQQLHSSMCIWLKFLDRTRTAWARTFEGRWMPNPTDMDWLFAQGGRERDTSRDRDDLYKLMPAVVEALRACQKDETSFIKFFPDFHEVFLERLRSRRPLNKAAREKLFKDIRSFRYPGDKDSAIRVQGDDLTLHANAAAIIAEQHRDVGPAHVQAVGRGRGMAQQQQQQNNRSAGFGGAGTGAGAGRKPKKRPEGVAKVVAKSANTNMYGALDSGSDSATDDVGSD